MTLASARPIQLPVEVALSSPSVNTETFLERARVVRNRRSSDVQMEPAAPAHRPCSPSRRCPVVTFLTLPQHQPERFIRMVARTFADLVPARRVAMRNAAGRSLPRRIYARSGRIGRSVDGEEPSAAVRLKGPRDVALGHGSPCWCSVANTLTVPSTGSSIGGED